MPAIDIRSVNATTVAASANVALAAGEAINYLVIWNTDATSTLWVCVDGDDAGVDNGFPLIPGAGYDFPHGKVPVDKVSVYSSGNCKYYVGWE